MATRPATAPPKHTTTLLTGRTILRHALARGCRPLRQLSTYPGIVAGLMVDTGARPPALGPDRADRYAARYPENEVLLEWLRKEVPEEVIEPELPIIDPHHHLWDLRGKDYGYGPKGQVVYQLDECLEDMRDGHNVVQTVFLQVMADGQFPNWMEATELPPSLRPLGEVEYCQGIAAICDAERPADVPRICAGIVGFADFSDPEVEPLLRAQARVRNMRGIRTPGDPDDEGFRRGMALLEELNMSYDYIGPLPALKEIALLFPNVRIILNHLGGNVGPAMESEHLERWKVEMADVAASCPNVFCKCGGVQMVTHGHGWETRATPVGSEELADAVLPYYRHAIECFGASRCMFESNFPPDKESCSYRTLYNAFKRMAATLELTPEEKADIFHDTALRAYRLDDAFCTKL